MRNITQIKETMMLQRRISYKDLVDKISTTYINSNHATLKACLNILISEHEYYSEHLESNDVKWLIFIIHQYKCLEAFYAAFPQTRNYIEYSDHIEMELYHQFYMECQKKQKQIMGTPTRFQINKNKDKLFRGIKEELKQQIFKYILENSIPYIAKVEVCKSEDIHKLCTPRHGQKIKRDIIILVHKNKCIKSILVKGVYSNKNKKYYILDSELWNISSLLTDHDIKNEMGQNIPKSVFMKENIVKNQPKTKYKTQKEVAVERKAKEFRQLLEHMDASSVAEKNKLTNFNEESSLKKMGYSTSKSRSQRWDVLNERGLDQLGRDNIIKHLEFLIRINTPKAQMRDAIKEWQYDLNRLKTQ